MFQNWHISIKFEALKRKYQHDRRDVKFNDVTGNIAQRIFYIKHFKMRQSAGRTESYWMNNVPRVWV